MYEDMEVDGDGGQVNSHTVLSPAEAVSCKFWKIKSSPIETLGTCCSACCEAAVMVLSHMSIVASQCLDYRKLREALRAM